MTFVRMAFFPGGTADHYASLTAQLRGAPAPPSRVVFLAGPRDGGWQVVQAWENAESLHAFNAEWLLPALTRLGSAGFPEPPIVHDFVASEVVLRPLVD